MADRSTRARAALTAFRKHLASDKFKGTEVLCRHCRQLLGSDGTCSVHPLVTPIIERKDWISTADVLRWLDQIDEHLSYDLPHLIDRS